MGLVCLTMGGNSDPPGNGRLWDRCPFTPFSTMDRSSRKEEPLLACAANFPRELGGSPCAGFILSLSGVDAMETKGKMSSLSIRVHRQWKVLTQSWLKMQNFTFPFPLWVLGDFIFIFFFHIIKGNLNFFFIINFLSNFFYLHRI